MGPKGKDLIYHLKNHDTDTESRIGYLSDIYEEVIALTDLGLNMVGSTTCLMFDTEVIQVLCENSYQQYLDKKVKQHSIGLRYVKLVLCINDSSDAEHFKNWNQYYQFVLNKNVIDEAGYFWAVTEIQLYEVSFVLWGANEITPCMDMEEDKSNEPLEDTQEKQEEPIIEITIPKTEEVKEKSILFYLN